MFMGLNFVQYKDKHMTLIELMIMHRKIFKMVENLHDLVCKGLKDYQQALHIVLEYNLTKTLTSRCCIPDLDGDKKLSRVEMNVLYSISNDIELYNYIDLVLRRHRVQNLQQFITLEEMGRMSEEENLAKYPDGHKKRRQDQNEESTETDSTSTPDGQPLHRVYHDFLANYWVN